MFFSSQPGWFDRGFSSSWQAISSIWNCPTSWCIHRRRIVIDDNDVDERDRSENNGWKKLILCWNKPNGWWWWWSGWLGIALPTSGIWLDVQSWIHSLWLDRPTRCSRQWRMWRHVTQGMICTLSTKTPGVAYVSIVIVIPSTTVLRIPDYKALPLLAVSHIYRHRVPMPYKVYIWYAYCRIRTDVRTIGSNLLLTTFDHFQ